MKWLQLIRCYFMHQHFGLGNPIWNGTQGRWMLWCGQCGDWRRLSRVRLEAKVRGMMDEALDRV